jgi:nucleotide-binding universal stress UspA family protein
MAEHILVPFDGSPLSERALDRAVTGHPDDTITVLHVIDPVLAVYQAEARGITEARAWVAETTEVARETADAAAALAADRGVAVDTAVATGRPAAVILDYAEAHDVDHIVMGSHGRSGASRLLLGSVAERVVRESPVPVTIVR